jgi:hypothetical protein
MLPLPLPLFPMLPLLTCCCRSCCCCRCCRAVPAATPAPTLVFACSAPFNLLCCSCSFGFCLCPFRFCSGSFALVYPAVHPYPLVWLSFAVVHAFCACALLLVCACPAVHLYLLGCAASCLFVCVCLSSFALIRAHLFEVGWEWE